MEAHRILNPAALADPSGGRLAAAARALVEETALDVTLKRVAAGAVQALAARRCLIYLRDGDTSDFVLAASHDLRARSVAPARIAATGAELRQVLAGGEPAELPLPPTGSGIRLRRSLVVRIPTQGSAGIMVFEPAPAGTPATRELAVAFAALAGAAVGSVQRRETSDQRARVLALKLAEERRLAAVEGELLGLAQSDPAPSDVACLLGTRLGRPCVVLIEPDEVLALLTPDLAGVECTTPRVVGPYPRLGIDGRLLVARIDAGRPEAMIVLSEANRPFTGPDLRLLSSAVVLLGSTLRAGRRALEAEQQASESLVRDVLQGSDSAGSLRARAGRLGLDLDGTNVVCRLSGGVGVEDVRRAAQSLGLTCCGHVASVRGETALIAPLHRGKPRHVAVGQVRSELGRLLGVLGRDDESALAIVSSTCRSVGQLAPALEECEQLLSLAAPGHPGPRAQVLCADDLGPARLLLGRLTPLAAERLVQDVLGPVVDREEGMKLLETLDAFFASNHVIRVTAAELGIHENTVRYRFRKLADATGLDLLARAEDQLTARLALTLLKLRSNVSITKELP